ncbi:MAG: response regulator [Planctomycetota bacterium]
MNSPGSFNGVRLLLVDDEPHVTHILARRLTKLGAEVRVARDGKEGLAEAIAFEPQVIVSDLQMPRMDGLDMAVALAANESSAGIPIVMISGRGFLLDDDRTRETRIVEILEKPFSISAVISVLSRILEAPYAGEAAA